MFVRSPRGSSEVVLSGSELVHVTLSLHRGEVLGGGHDAERHAVCSSGGDPGRGSRLPESSELALGEAAICDYVVSVSGDDCGAGVCHCSRAASTSASPEHVAESDLRNPKRSGQPYRIVAVVGVGSETVNLLRVQPRILARRQNGLERQLELGIRTLPSLVIGALANPDDAHLVFYRVR